MNCINLIGRACAQPVIRYTASTNRPVAEFTLAFDDPFNKDPQTNKPRSYFFLVVIWGQKAETAHQYIVKGQKIGITGRLTQEQYTPKDADKPITKTRIVAESFDLLEKPKDHQSTDSSWRPADKDQPAANEAPEEDDIPF
jgi:single-strand DNA-binding protein